MVFFCWLFTVAVLVHSSKALLLKNKSSFGFVVFSRSEACNSTPFFPFSMQMFAQFQLAQLAGPAKRSVALLSRVFLGSFGGVPWQKSSEFLNYSPFMFGALICMSTCLRMLTIPIQSQVRTRECWRRRLVFPSFDLSCRLSGVCIACTVERCCAKSACGFVFCVFLSLLLVSETSQIK